MRHVVATFVVLKLAFCCAKLRVDFLKTAVDECLGLFRYLVLVGICLPVVTYCELAEEILSTFHVLVLERNQCYGSIFRCGFNRHGVDIACPDNRWRQHSHVHGSLLEERYDIGVGVSGERKRARCGLNRCRERFDG